MKIQSGIVINKGATSEKPVEKDNVVTGTTSPEPKTAETTTVTAKAGDAVVATTTTKPTSTTTATKTEEKKAEMVVVRKDGDGGLTINAGDGIAHGGDVNVTVNFGTINTNA